MNIEEKKKKLLYDHNCITQGNCDKNISCTESGRCPYREKAKLLEEIIDEEIGKKVHIMPDERLTEIKKSISKEAFQDGINASIQADEILREEGRRDIIEEIEKQGTVIHQGELPKGIHGLLIDIEKIKSLFPKEDK